MIVLDSSNFYACIWQSLSLDFSLHALPFFARSMYFLLLRFVSVVFIYFFFSSISSELIFRTKTRSYRILAVLHSHFDRAGDKEWASGRLREKERVSCSSERGPHVLFCLCANEYHTIFSIDHGKFFDFDEMETSDYIHMHFGIRCRVVAIVLIGWLFACTNRFYGDFFPQNFTTTNNNNEIIWPEYVRNGFHDIWSLVFFGNWYLKDFSFKGLNWIERKKKTSLIDEGIMFRYDMHFIWLLKFH